MKYSYFFLLRRNWKNKIIARTFVLTSLYRGENSSQTRQQHGQNAFQPAVSDEAIYSFVTCSCNTRYYLLVEGTCSSSASGQREMLWHTRHLLLSPPPPCYSYAGLATSTTDTLDTPSLNSYVI